MAVRGLRGWTKPAEYIEGDERDVERGQMAISEQAGKPVDPSALIDVDALIASYYETTPDPTDPAQRPTRRERIAGTV